MRKIIAKEIWYLSESFNIPLGRFAPVIVGWMLGTRGNKTK